MNQKYCDAGRVKCPHLPECGFDCHFETAVLAQKIKLYPAVVPNDIEPVSDTWRTVSAVMLTAIFGALAVVCILIFFTGVWVWSLLI